MRSRARDVFMATLTGTICGLLVWHAVSWHLNGTHARLYERIVQEGAIFPAFYNLGLIIVLSLSLGLMMQSILSATGYTVKRIRHFEDEKR